MMKIANPIGSFTVLGGLAMIVGVFLGWYDTGITVTTGLEILTDNPMNLDSSYVPAVILVLGVLVTLVSIVAMVKEGKTAMNTSLVSVLLSIVAVIAAGVFMTETDPMNALGNFAGQGLWLSMIGCAAAFIGGLTVYFILNGERKAAEAGPAE